MMANAPETLAQGSLMAGGQAISDTTASEAAAWLTVLMDDKVSDAERARWLAWREAHPDNERAWRHIESVGLRLKAFDHAAYKALSSFNDGTSKPRRQVLRAAAGLGVAAWAGWFVPRTTAWQVARAEYSTGVGEQRTIQLDDGTELVLNTDTALNVQFDAAHRLIRLFSGEVLITTGHAPSGEAERPFIVETAQGRVQALGTRFTVHAQGQSSHVSVFEGAVRVSPLNQNASSRVLGVGQAGRFTESGIDPLVADAQTADWAKGVLHADDMRLEDFLAALGRYRRGVVVCDPGIADLRLSGVFPLRDTDQALALLPNSLPVEIRYRTRYWVSVLPQ